MGRPAADGAGAGVGDPPAPERLDALVAEGARGGGTLRVARAQTWPRSQASRPPRDRLRCLHDGRELLGELRWSRAEVERTRDGLDVRTLGLPVAELPGLLSLQRPEAWRLLAQADAGARLEASMARVYGQSHAYGLLRAQSDGGPGWLALGETVLRIWLEATAQGLAVAPTTILPWLGRLTRTPGHPLAEPGWATRIRPLEDDLRRRFGVGGRPRLVFLFRLSRATPTRWPALRRPVLLDGA